MQKFLESLSFHSNLQCIPLLLLRGRKCAFLSLPRWLELSVYLSITTEYRQNCGHNSWLGEAIGSWTWWGTPVIQLFGRQKQKDHQNSRPVWGKVAGPWLKINFFCCWMNETIHLPSPSFSGHDQRGSWDSHLNNSNQWWLSLEWFVLRELQFCGGCYGSPVALDMRFGLRHPELDG
jgi:hypothetical protein